MRHTKMLPDTEKALVEMLVFTPLCVHENPQDILIIGNRTLPQEAKKIAKNITVIDDFSSLTDVGDKKFDIVISFEEVAPYDRLSKYITKDAILSCKAKADTIAWSLKTEGKSLE